MELIDELFTDQPFYGARKITAYLRAQGKLVSRKKVTRLMLMGLRPIYQKPNLSKPGAEHKKYPYLLKNLFPSRPNQFWSTDITYIPIKGGFLYLGACRR